MNCDNLIFECATIINLIIGGVIGFGLSVTAAYFYEKFSNKRIQNDLLNKFKFLESKDNSFDWQHWDVSNGKIADTPKESYKKIKYIGEKTFNFEWIESKNGRIEGEGKMIWKDITHGTMSFFSINTILYGNRDIFYRKINHKGIKYDAIFVNAEDQNYDYVLMRKSVHK